MSLRDRFLNQAEKLLYGKLSRRLCLVVIILLTAVLAWQATGIKGKTSFSATVPLDQPFMKVYLGYQNQIAGGNTLLVALQRKHGNIYNEQFLQELKDATNTVFFTPGIDRSQVYSLFTRNVRYVEIVNGGFSAGDVVPRTYTPTPSMFNQIRSNVAKANLVGRLVSKNQQGALVKASVLDLNPATGAVTDYTAIAHRLSDRIRGRLTSPWAWQMHLRWANKGIKAGTVVATRYEDPGWRQWISSYPLNIDNKDESDQKSIPGYALEAVRVKNPDYDPDLSVHIIGFAQEVGDISDATVTVMGFFVLTLIGTMLALWWFLGNLRLAALPMACSLIAVMWEFGLLKILGYGLDPFAILVPFLVLAVSTSHGVQYVNSWSHRVLDGDNGMEASRNTFRHLFVPGAVALITNVVGFLTIAWVPIGSLREMAINASLGMFAVIITNKVLMPIWLSYLRVERFPQLQKNKSRLNAGDWLWNHLAVVTQRPVAVALLGLAFVVLIASAWLQQYRIIGDSQVGVPELRPDSVYNKDVRAITSDYSIGTDVLTAIAENTPASCVDYLKMAQIDRFAWSMWNDPGVRSVRALTETAKGIYSGMMEGSPKFHVLPRNRSVLVLATQGIDTTSGLLNNVCSAMPVYIFAGDHRATTIDRLVSEVQNFNKKNAASFFEDHPESSPERCDERIDLRHRINLLKAKLRDLLIVIPTAGGMAPSQSPEVKALKAKVKQLETRRDAITDACPVNFALGGGNLGVMAATNDVVRHAEIPLLFWVYAAIALLLLVAYRSVVALLAIGIPLALVSVFANALMAELGIGLKVATLPVVTLAVGIGVDYGIYVYDMLHQQMRDGRVSLRDAYLHTLRHSGKAVIFTGICLAGGVLAWLFSSLQFQRDMGLLLVFMFIANMLGAILLCPALCSLLLTRRKPSTKQ